MPRSSRIFIDCACYHITTRGNQKQEVFFLDEDYEKYIHTLKKAKRKYEIMLYAYCLMPNHVHLLIEANMSKNISKLMHWLTRGYTEYHNTKYQKVGHLWQGRFKNHPIIKGRYLVNAATYIENNPVRARFGTARLIKLLKANASTPLNLQQEILEKELDNWQQRQAQRDDITIVALKF